MRGTRERLRQQNPDEVVTKGNKSKKKTGEKKEFHKKSVDTDTVGLMPWPHAFEPSAPTANYVTGHRHCGAKDRVLTEQRARLHVAKQRDAGALHTVNVRGAPFIARACAA